MLYLKSLEHELLIDLTQSHIRIFPFSMFDLHVRLGFEQILLSQFLSSDSQSSFPLMDFVEILPVSQRLHNVLISISLPFWFQVESGNDGLSVHVCKKKFPHGTTVNQLISCQLFPEAIS